VVNWKSRYAELLDQRERQTERYRRKYELLAAALISAGQLARGVDEAADEKLLAIQGLLRQDKLKNVDLEPAVRALDKQLQRSLETRQAKLKRITASVRQLSTQVRSLASKAVTVQALKSFEKDLGTKPRSVSEMPELLDRLLLLHKTAVRQGKQSSGHSVWRRWFAGSTDDANTDGLAPEAYDEIEAEKGTDLGIESEIDHEIDPELDPELDLEMGPEIDPELDLEMGPEIDSESDPESDPESDSESDPESDPELESRPGTEVDTQSKKNDRTRTNPAARNPLAKQDRINIRELLSNRFTTLLQQLGNPEDIVATERLLASNFPLDQVPDIVSSVCELTTDSLNRDRREASATLDRINTRLNESNFSVTACQTLNQASAEADKALHSSMASSFDAMQSSVTSTTDIEQLKRDFSHQMKQMSSVLATHQTHAEQQSMTAALGSLAQNIQRMENMTEAAGMRLDIQSNHALTDTMTGLPNQTAYQVRAAKLLKSWQMERFPLCVAVCKINYYQLLLKRLDSEQFEVALKSLADGLRRHVRSNDQAFRINKETFVVLLPNATKEQAHGVMEPFRESIANDDHQNGAPLRVAVTTGIANFKGNDNLASAFTRADRACEVGDRNQTKLSPN
jgi:diguanylate cyclase (GGDEF)-like protein